ncbi:MAG TPA: LPS-assembly protein LptD [Anaeromyxobacteraceae bacterium]|nr:LPS-assembly protein LptD [Anaeromyxobacteraceae bacterium]
MLGLVALLAAGLAAPAPAASTLPAPGGTVEVEAAQVVYDAGAARYRLEGGVRLRRGTTVLRAGSASYDPASGTIDATGDVLLTGPGRAVAAGSARLVLDGPWEARRVVAYLKQEPLDLGSAESIDAACRRGRNRLSLTADRLAGEGGESFVAEGVRLTLCDCDGGAPSWEVRASRAQVEPGEGAVLSWPVVRITPRFLFLSEPVPVLPLPWLYLPLAERRTGLLLPGAGYGSRTGWTLSQPFFLVLSRSLDATLTLDYAFGPPGGPKPGLRAVEGPGATAELRWAPAEQVAGQAEVDWLKDRHADPGDPGGGDRYALRLTHAGPLSDRSALAAEVRLVGDPAWLDDFAGNLLIKSAPYLRSAAALSFRWTDLLLAAEADYHLAIGSLKEPATTQVPFGLFGSQVPAFHRMPGASATLLPQRLAGPVRFSGSLSAARFAPVQGVSNRADGSGLAPGDLGWAGTLPLPPADAWAPGQRLSANRLAAEAELRAPFALGRALALEPWARGRAAGYAFGDGASPAGLDAWLSGGLTVSTRLSRVFGEGADRLRHDIEPRVEWRGGTGLAGPDLPAWGYDELDRAAAPSTPCLMPPAGLATGQCLPMRTLSAAPPGTWSQLRLALRNRLTVPSGSLSRTALDLDLGQDFDLGRGALGETWARAGVLADPLTFGLTARFLSFGAEPPPGSWTPVHRSWLDAFTELRADLGLHWKRGDRVHAGLLALGEGASGALRAGTDPLFDDRAIAFAAQGQGSAGARVRVAGGLDVSYDALFNLRTVTAPGCNVSRSPVEWSPHVQQHLAALVWDSPCKCWRAALRVRVSDCGDFGVGATLDLGELAGLRFSP